MASEKKRAALAEDELMDEDEIIVAMTDEDGNEAYFVQELILPVDGEKYALLVPACAGEEEGHDHEDGGECCCGDEEDAAFFAKIVLDEDGEETYIEPTDEEFEAVCAAYEKLMDEEEDEAPET